MKEDDLMLNPLKFIIDMPLIEEFRKDALRDKFTISDKEITVDTCNTTDCGWETAIKVNDEYWIVVETYLNKEIAYKKHVVWVKMMKENPNRELKNCTSAMDWFFGESKNGANAMGIKYIDSIKILDSEDVSELIDAFNSFVADNIIKDVQFLVENGRVYVCVWYERRVEEE